MVGCLCKEPYHQILLFRKRDLTIDRVIDSIKCQVSFAKQQYLSSVDNLTIDRQSSDRLDHIRSPTNKYCCFAKETWQLIESITGYTRSVDDQLSITFWVSLAEYCLFSRALMQKRLSCRSIVKLSTLDQFSIICHRSLPPRIQFFLEN